jgi:DNA-binding transcriptional LysR family regulator
MTLQQLQYVVAAAGHGSFTAAASALRLAQPSLSEQVRRLEAELGVDLFVRSGRGLTLTDAGREILPHAERALEAVDDVREAVRSRRELRGGVAVLGTFGTASHYLLGDLVEDFRVRHPDVAVRVIGQNSSEVADAVRDGRLEAGLIVLPIDDQGLDVRPVVRDEVLYVSADPEHLREPVGVAALAGARLILYDARFGWSDPTRRQLLERAQREGVRLEPAIEVEELDAALDLAARGLGDTIVARWVAGGPRFPRNLGLVSLDPPVHDTFAVISRRGARLSPATRALLELAESHLARLERRRRGDVG